MKSNFITLMALTDMLRQCGTPLPPMTKAKLYITDKDELAAWPDTQFAIDTAALDTPDKGDKKRLGEAFDFTGAGSGLGFWRQYDILVDTGILTIPLEGEIGGQGYRQRLECFMMGLGPVESEQADDFLAFSGCMIAMIGLKTGDYVVLGDLENPVFVETGEGTTNERVGFAYTFYSNTGLTPSFYDADTLGIDTTPEV